MFRGHAILHTLEAIIIKLHEPCPTIYGPADQTQSPFTIVQIDGVEFCEREKTQENRQQDPRSFEHITSHPLGMGIYSISANYSPHDSLSNGIIITESFLTNSNIWVTKVGRIGKNPILGTSCWRGLTLSCTEPPYGGTLKNTDCFSPK
jgi:hypothetical protein